MSNLFAIPPSAVRVWRGYRDPKLQQSDFFDKLGTVFIPATVQMQIAVGLQGYLPSVPAGLPAKPDAVPDETAILFWESQQTYADGFKTLAVRTYTLTHNAVYRAPSGANFPTLFAGELNAEQPVYLFDRPADWMRGPVRHLIGGRAANVTPAVFRANLATALAQLQRTTALDGAIACAGDDYLVYWELGAADPARISALSGSLGWSKLVDCAPTALDSGLWNEWPGMTIQPGASFNMQFRRRWER